MCPADERTVDDGVGCHFSHFRHAECRAGQLGRVERVRSKLGGIDECPSVGRGNLGLKRLIHRRLQEGAVVESTKGVGLGQVPSGSNWRVAVGRGTLHVRRAAHLMFECVAHVSGAVGGWRRREIKLHGVAVCCAEFDWPLRR